MEKQKTQQWYVCGTANGQRIIIDEPTGTHIAVVYDPDDAPVLAAAPDLLAAVIGLMEVIECADMQWTGEQQADVLKRIAAARAAIAKAEGSE